MKDTTYSNGTVPEIDGTVLDQDWLNAVNDEIGRVIDEYLNSPTQDGTDNGQLFAAIRNATSGRGNLFDNADFKVSQRGVAGAVTTEQWITDRWRGWSSGAAAAMVINDMANVWRSAETNGQAVLELSVPQGDVVSLAQRVENPLQFFGVTPQALTVSGDFALLEAAIGGIQVTVKLYVSDGIADELVGTGTIDVTPNTVAWTRGAVTITPTAPTSVIPNGGRDDNLRVVFEFPSPPTEEGTWAVTALRLEKSAGATEFTSLPFEEDLRRCARYFERSWPARNVAFPADPYNLAPATPNSDEGVIITRGIRDINGVLELNTRFRSIKRVVPDVTWYDQDGNVNTITHNGGSQPLDGATPSLAVSTAATGYPKPAANNLFDVELLAHFTADAEFPNV